MNVSGTPVQVEAQTSDLTTTVTVLTLTLLIPGVLVGVTGNSLICVCVYRVRSLRTPVNSLVFNLATTGLLATLTCVPLLVSLVVDTIVFTNQVTSVRDIFVAENSAFVLFSSVQLVTLACISFERYQAIAKPFEKSKRAKRVKISLVALWILSGMLCVCYVITEIITTSNVGELLNAVQMVDNIFIVYVFIPFCFAVLIAIILLYSFIIRLIRLHVQKTDRTLSNKKNKVSPANASTTDNTDDMSNVRNLVASLSDKRKEAIHSQTPSVSTQLFVVSESEQPSKLPSKLSDVEETNKEQVSPDQKSHDTAPQMTSSRVIDVQSLNNPTERLLAESEKTISGDPTSTGNTSGNEQPSNQTSTELNKEPTCDPKTAGKQAASGETLLVSSAKQNVDKEKHVIEVCDITGNVAKIKTETNLVSGDICVMNTNNREQGRRRIEVRTAKLAGLVIVTFLVLWLPYQLLLIYQHVMHAASDSVDALAQDRQWGSHLVLQALALCAVMVSPFVFALVNKDLKREILKLLKLIAAKCPRIKGK